MRENVPGTSYEFLQSCQAEFRDSIISTLHMCAEDIRQNSHLSDFEEKSDTVWSTRTYLI